MKIQALLHLKSSCEGWGTGEGGRVGPGFPRIFTVDGLLKFCPLCVSHPASEHQMSGTRVEGFLTSFQLEVEIFIETAVKLDTFWVLWPKVCLTQLEGQVLCICH